MNGNDEWQQRTNVMQLVLVVPAFSPVASQPLSWADVVFTPEYLSSGIFVVVGLRS